MTVDRRLELSFLGGFDIRLDGSPLATNAYSKMRALLAYLAMEQHAGHHREVLAELLWSDSRPATARGNLRRTLSDLRRMLESPAGMPLFAVDSQSIRFIADSVVDAGEFNRPLPLSGDDMSLDQEERIAALYRGEFLAGFSLPDCPNFESWLQGWRETLHRRALALLERLSNAHEQQAAYDKALQFAQRQTELAPWDEPAHRRVMRLYALNGQTAAALAQYETCRRCMKDGLGALPSDETSELAQRIRNGELRPSQIAALETPIVQTLSVGQAERRQVTVLYCELAFPEVDDPDETMGLLQAPQAQCVDIVRQFSGHVVQAYGGGLLAYFGYPRADEHAARRAVQAGLAISAWVAAAGLEIRVGVHTGLMVTDGISGLPDTSGRTSRLAILLHNFAAHNEVAISRETHDVIAGFFDCTPSEAVPLPGFGRAVEVFRVQGESGARTRIDASARLTPLVGREDEISRLMTAWEAAAAGTSQIVLLQGEAGIGKTRLIHTVRERLAGRPHALRELRCFPEFAQSPLHPLITLLEGNAGFTPGDAPDTRFQKLTHYLDTYFPDTTQEAIHLLASLLSLSPGSSLPAAEASPKRQKERTFILLLRLLRLLAAEQPVLVIVEDLHWIDPSLLELLTLLITSAEKMPVLVLLTARPEFVVPWRDEQVTRLALGPLVDEDVANMITRLSEGIQPATVRRIVERADGVPLFAEEMAKIVAVDKQARVPTTLLDLLMARMDGMGEAKRTAQLAATLGREFDTAVLHRVSPDPKQLTQHLAALQDAGLVLTVAGTQCQFKHALIQEVAYQSQSLPDRQAAHRRIADVLRKDLPEVVAAQPELLAQHLADAGETWLSIEYWIQAGQRAAQKSANLEAIGHFHAALKLLETLPEDQERLKTEFNILVSLFPVLYATEGYGSKEAGRVNARIAALCGMVGDSPDIFAAKWTVLVNTIGSVGPRGIPEAVEQLLTTAQGDAVRLQAAHHLGTNCCFWLGEFEASVAHYESSAALYRPEQVPLLLAQYGSDLSVFNTSYGMFALHMLGFPDRAQAVCAEGLARARTSAHQHTLAQALSFAATLQRWQNKPDEALALSTEAIAIAREQDFPLWLVSAGMSSGWARAVLGDPEGGIAEVKFSIEGMRAAIGGISVVFLSALVHTLVHLGRYGEALDAIAETLADAARNGDGHYLAELHRLKAECLLAAFPDQAKQAEAQLDEALAISRRQNATGLELRAATSLARLWQQQGKRAAARRLLAKVYGRFTEGFASHDLRQAATLLHSLN